MWTNPCIVELKKYPNKYWISKPGVGTRVDIHEDKCFDSFEDAKTYYFLIL